MAQKLPPLTTADVKDSLADPSFSVYVYIGSEDDLAWENAELLFGLLPRLRLFLAEDEDSVAEWTDGDASIAGLVFGFETPLVSTLDQDQAEDLRAVLDAITGARDE